MSWSMKTVRNGIVTGDQPCQIVCVRCDVTVSFAVSFKDFGVSIDRDASRPLIFIA
jgi:hypothetical protein